MSDPLLKISVSDGKYTLIQDDKGLRALRYGEEWRDLTGDGLVLALGYELEEARELNKTLINGIEEFLKKVKETGK